MKECLIKDCSRKFYARGFCKLHYGHWIGGGDVQRDPKRGKNPPQCIVEGCGRKPRVKGYCSRHYQVFRAHGKIVGNPTRSTRQRNEAIFEGDVCRIKLYDLHSNEIGETVIAAADYPSVREYKWRPSGIGYVITGQRGNEFSIAHKILGIKPNAKVLIDHVNRNKLDNRRENLRTCNRSQNAINSKMRRDNTSGFKGVSWVKTRRRWQAYIRIDGKSKNLGKFQTKEEAVKARLEAEQKYYGDFRT